MKEVKWDHHCSFPRKTGNDVELGKWNEEDANKYYGSQMSKNPLF
jgi:hypothetical protein